MKFLEILQKENPGLYYFGWILFISGCIFILFSFNTQLKVAGANAWHKPIKFAFSIGIYCWSMAWYMKDLRSFPVQAINMAIYISMGFEIIYIAVQAARGQASHFNVGTPFYAGLYALMAIGATIAAICAAVVGWAWWNQLPEGISNAYLWAVRFGFVLFVIFSFQGFMMGSKLAHTVGAEDGGRGLPFLNWSREHGDLRIAHFLGMHALQILPLMAFYFLRNTTGVILVALAYAAATGWVLVKAIWGKPLL